MAGHMRLVELEQVWGSVFSVLGHMWWRLPFCSVLVAPALPFPSFERQPIDVSCCQLPPTSTFAAAAPCPWSEHLSRALLAVLNQQKLSCQGSRA